MRRRQGLDLDLGRHVIVPVQCLVDHFVNKRFHVHLALDHGLPAQPGKGQQIVDHFPHARAVAADHGKIPASLGVEPVG